MRQKRLYATSVVLALVLALLPYATTPAKAATYTVTMTADRNTPALCPVLSCSLREAITNANSTAGPHTISFDIDSSTDPGCAGGVCTLTLNPAYGALAPLMQDYITIDGTTDPDDTIEIDCTSSDDDCLRIYSASNTIKGLVINRCDYAGVLISGVGAQDNKILGCSIGTDATGELYGFGNGESGVIITNGAAYNEIGDLGTENRNVISANGDDGVWISGGDTDDNSVINNYIGTDKDGEADLGNAGRGIFIYSNAENNVIGSISGGRNVISGNGLDGIQVRNADGNQIVVNYIGTDKDGETGLGNNSWGMHFWDGASNNQVGSILEATLVSGNGAGILIEGTGTYSNTVINSYVGTDVHGDTDLGNSYDGVQISNGAQGNTIGGDGMEERNVISGNEGYGVYIDNADNNTVSGNYIGTAENGAVALGNNYTGVWIANGSTNNTIGGDTEGKKNVISGNGAGGASHDGVTISSSSANTVQGNHIGLRADGYGPLANPDDGVTIINGVGNLVKDNIISGNGGHGLYIDDGPSTQVTGNIIGLRKGSGMPVANGECGIHVNSGDGIVIGGQASGDHNTIAGNAEHGIVISNTTSTISGTVIMGNHIGTNPSDWSWVGNGGIGVYLYGRVQYSTIGGDEAGEENVISSNGDSGIVLECRYVRYNVVSRNHIGLNSAGSSTLSNGQHGVEIRIGASYNTVGGGSASQRNYIAGNDYGVVIYDQSRVNRTHDNQVIGNYIGTNSAGTASLGNTTGVAIYDNGRDNTVADNLISGNAQYGVYISSNDSYGNVLQGNYIGTNAGGAGALANGGSGVYVGDSAQNNRIGPDNVIAFNGGDGVRVDGGTTWHNTITATQIYSNALKGIENINGGNIELTPPVIIGTGPITGTACANCVVQIFSDDEDEGRIYHGFTTADATGNFAYTNSVTGPYVTATATDGLGNTSEFSVPVEAGGGAPGPGSGGIYLPIITKNYP